MASEKQVIHDDSVWGVTDVTSSKGKDNENFPVGSLLIAQSLRPVVHAYYQFARTADDMVDNPFLSSEQKIARLQALREVLHGERKAPNREDAQTAVRLRALLLEREIPLETASDLIVAFCWDAEKNRYQSWEELLKYCRYSANPVGRFLLALHHETEESWKASDALCTALQVVNHLQDVSADLRTLDRCYVPMPWLEEAGVRIEDLALGRSKPGVRRVFDRILTEVEKLNDQAALLPSFIRDRRMRLEAVVIVQLCHRLTERLRYQDPIAERVALSKADGMRALLHASRFVF
ncbi:squalene synthase HpnC [Saccharibacter sp. 17.LH.SD]|uniref:squalene synthase HpnC n=1 Tax=Saccharibacter sp. 17.LH.SD TaxID=2689393 RepID=UPI00136E50CB|nr:squalene synthase HpnC [Saccharibacter sp. 17.LH.SD]MXV44205.1 squalene synthase HpnC [Saccharibacter sp. 17.LH.SD]